MQHRNRVIRGLSRGLVPSVATVLSLASCSGCSARQSPQTGGGDGSSSPSGTLETATFAGGCFWCMESAFEGIPGVESVISGFTGGEESDPTYEQVSSGRTGHYEAIRLTYDNGRASYEDLLRVFWRQIDPTDAGGQFVDRGTQYRSAVFVHDDVQRGLAEASRAALEASGRFASPIVTPILPAGPFYPAEDYHQDFYQTHPDRYASYRSGSGRDQYLDRVWGDEPHGPHAFEARCGQSYERPSDEELQRQLTPLQYEVTQENGTERPFDNAFWNEHRDGIYVDVVSGEPLFSSRDKFDSGTGWPSFTRPLVAENVVGVEDRSHGMVRVEVRSRHGDSHLGHLFDDGPQPTGLRYCINSAALRFVPAEDLERACYGELADLFE